MWGSGNPRREFLYSEDMADACVFIMENRNFQDIVNQQVVSSKLQVENCKTTFYRFTQTSVFAAQ
jgi:GDP-L-fucose synthase